MQRNMTYKLRIRETWTDVSDTWVEAKDEAEARSIAAQRFRGGTVSVTRYKKRDSFEIHSCEAVCGSPYDYGTMYIDGLKNAE